MHTLTKIKLFRALLWVTYPFALIFLYPLALLKKKSNAQVFFFFDRNCIGGAQTVHVDILSSVPDIKKHIFFTRKSPNNIMLKTFQSLAVCEDIHFWCDNLLLRIFSVHYYAFYVNRHKNLHVFGANSTYFYDIIRFLKRNIIKTELLHAFTFDKKGGMEYFGLATHKYLDNRMTVDRFTRQNIFDLYQQYGVQSIYNERVHVIEPGVYVPDIFIPKENKELSLLFVGRAGPPKRIYLLSKMAEICLDRKLPVKFHFAGNPEEELSERVIQASVIHGNITDKKKLYDIYQSCDVIMIISYFEGFPMVVKEGMACGCIPMVTALGGMLTHLQHLKNAVIIDAVHDEDEVVNKGIENIVFLLQHPELKPHLSRAAYDHAREYFNIEHFRQTYYSFFKQYV